jgi:hypothetical protein
MSRLHPRHSLRGRTGCRVDVCDRYFQFDRTPAEAQRQWIEPRVPQRIRGIVIMGAFK